MSEEAFAGTLSLCNGAADSAASTSMPETFIKLEMQTAQKSQPPTLTEPERR